MLRDQTRPADHDDSTTADHGIVFTGNLLAEGTRVCLPEISLVAAIFEDAVRCTQRASSGVTHRQCSEAFEWLASERRDWPFAFVNVCDLLGVDAKAVRKRLRIRDKASGNGSIFESADAGDRPREPSWRVRESSLVP
jgi:hypothetical protein